MEDYALRNRHGIDSFFERKIFTRPMTLLTLKKLFFTSISLKSFVMDMWYHSTDDDEVSELPFDPAQVAGMATSSERGPKSTRTFPESITELSGTSTQISTVKTNVNTTSL